MEIRIVNGAANMPAYGGILEKEEMNAIIAFLTFRNSCGEKFTR